MADYANDAWDEGGGLTLPADYGALDTFRARFQDALLQLDVSVAKLDLAERQLMEAQDKAFADEQTKAEWWDEYNKVNAAQVTVQQARDAANTLSDWWASAKNTFGLSAVRAGLLAGLGALPVAIPWATLAIITGGAAAIAAVVASVNAFIDRLNLKAWNDENIRRSQQGLPPLDDATRPVPVSTPGIFAQASELGKVAILGALIILILPRLMKG